MAAAIVKSDRSVAQFGRGANWLSIKMPRPLRWLAGAMQAVRGIIYPPLCLACDADLDDVREGFCQDCLVEIIARSEHACPRCALRVGPYVDTTTGCVGCVRERFYFDRAIRLGSYAGRLREVLLSFKSVHNELLGPALVRELMREEGEIMRSIDAGCVISVPLHFVRRFQRGFNQAETLARCLAWQLNLPHRSRILKRVRRTRPQSELKRDARRDNVRDAFWARPAACLKGATVLLVDDILTTGATCSEAARALKAAGAARVVVVVIARSQEQPRG